MTTDYSLSSFTRTVTRIIRSFSPAEKTLFGVLVGIALLGGLALAHSVNQWFVTQIPARGGEITEGIIGSPRFINSLLAISDADRDLSLLVYSGLMRATPDGEIIPDIAERYTVSEDGLRYTFILREDAVFHDGVPVTADDILFTILKAQDPALKSPKRAGWSGVTAEKISEREVVFTLKQPYALFIENTTLGILPKHIWEGADIEEFPFSQFNIEPIGSGPYRVENIQRNASGIPKQYELSAFKDFALGTPYISKLFVKFYVNEEALAEAFRKNEVGNIHSISASTVERLETKNTRVVRAPFPRIFAVFFNQNQAPLFTHEEVRRALDTAIDKEHIVSAVLGGYGTAIDSPVPPGIVPAAAKETRDTEQEETSDPKARAREILEGGGWTWDEEERVWTKRAKNEAFRLAFSLATSNTPELKQAAEIIANEWRTIGAHVDLHVFETGDLNQNVIRSRRYDALFFGEVVGRELDLFAFWHSSQRNDPGLNIALYANITADKLLEEARVLQEKEARFEKYRAFEMEIKKDIPAVFVYVPDFVYLVPSHVEGMAVGPITTPSERFLNVHQWYIETDSVWNIFIRP